MEHISDGKQETDRNAKAAGGIPPGSMERDGEGADGFGWLC